MIKNLRFSLLSMLMLICGSAFAGTIVFGDLGLENGVQYKDAFDGGDFTVTFAGGANDGKYYTTGSGIRVYGGGTMTITAKSGTLTKIQITYDGTYKPTTADVVSTGSYDPNTGLWTGDAESVVFTRPSGSGHWRVQKIQTGSDIEEEQLPTEGQTAEEAITVARAMELIEDLENGKTTSYTYYVKGVVVSIEKVTTGSSGAATFLIADDEAAPAALKVYNAKGLENKAVSDADFLKAGDAVVVIGVLQKYVKDDVVTPEVSSGYIYSINGNTKAEEVQEPTIEGGTTPETAITVSEALSAIGTMKNGQITTASYYVKGTVDEVSEINTTNGNATFIMRGETGAPLTVFRVKGLENKNITKEDYLKASDEVIVYAKLQNYVKDEVSTPELSSGYIYSLNGETKENVEPIGPVEFVGDGSEDNPFVIGDLKQMTEDTYPSDPVWVKGYILGSAKSGSALNDSENNVDSNIAIGEATTAEFVPVALAANTDARAMLNVKDNPDNIGKEVKVHGQIMKYFSVTGVKNLDAFEIDGVVTAIKSVETQQADAAVYNMAGQRVVKAQKGLFIQNGKKVIK